MTKPTIQENNMTRELTDDEYTAWLANKKATQEMMTRNTADIAAAKKSAYKKLAALGLTAAEIAAL